MTDADEVFAQIVANDTAEEIDAVMDRIIEAERESRHAIICNGDHDAAGRAANDAYLLMTGLSLNKIPTLVMGLADRFNREHEILTTVLDWIEETTVLLDIPVSELNDRGVLISQMCAASDKLNYILSHVPYEKVTPDEQ